MHFIGLPLCLLPALISLSQTLFLRNVLTSTLGQLHIARNQMLLHQLPTLQTKLAHRSRHDLHECYDPSFEGGEQVDIFRLDIFTIVHRYFRSKQSVANSRDSWKTRRRVKTFVENLRFVAQLVSDCLEQRPGHRTRWGLTSMSALSADEYRRIAPFSLPPRGHFKSKKNRHRRCSLSPQSPAEHQLPERFNWLDYGLYSPVRDQASSGWCAIFSTISALEYAYQIANRGKPGRQFSQKAIGACNTASLNEGMYVEDVLEQVMRKGVTLFEDAPYDNENSTCQPFPTFPDLRLRDYCVHYPNEGQLSEQDMSLMVYRNGPSVVAINSRSNAKFAFLRSARWNEPCDTQFDHAVLLVGWDATDWILKNSWGDWADRGFFRLPRGMNKCGIQTFVSSVIL